jgi:hypothetical protein
MLLRGPADSHFGKMEVSIEAPAKVPKLAELDTRGL